MRAAGGGARGDEATASRGDVSRGDVRLSLVADGGDLGAGMYAVAFGDLRLLINCGVGRATAAWASPPPAALLRTIRPHAVLLTRGQLEQVGGLAELVALAPEVPVYAAPATRALAALVVGGWHGAQGGSARAGGAGERARDAAARVRRATMPVELGVPTVVARTPTVTAAATFLRGGGDVSTTMLVLDLEREGPGGRDGLRVAFAGGAALRRDGAAAPADVRGLVAHAPDVVVSEGGPLRSGDGLGGAGGGAGAAAFVAVIREALAAGSRVLVPAMALGEAQDVAATLARAGNDAWVGKSGAAEAAGGPAGAPAGVPGVGGVSVAGLAAEITRVAAAYPLLLARTGVGHGAPIGGTRAASGPASGAASGAAPQAGRMGADGAWGARLVSSRAAWAGVVGARRGEGGAQVVVASPASLAGGASAAIARAWGATPDGDSPAGAGAATAHGVAPTLVVPGRATPRWSGTVAGLLEGGGGAGWRVVHRPLEEVSRIDVGARIAAAVGAGRLVWAAPERVDAGDVGEVEAWLRGHAGARAPVVRAARWGETVSVGAEPTGRAGTAVRRREPASAVAARALVGQGDVHARAPGATSRYVREALVAGGTRPVTPDEGTPEAPLIGARPAGGGGPSPLAVVAAEMGGQSAAGGRALVRERWRIVSSLVEARARAGGTEAHRLRVARMGVEVGDLVLYVYGHRARYCLSAAVLLEARAGRFRALAPRSVEPGVAASQIAARVGPWPGGGGSAEAPTPQLLALLEGIADAVSAVPIGETRGGAGRERGGDPGRGAGAVKAGRDEALAGVVTQALGGIGGPVLGRLVARAVGAACAEVRALGVGSPDGLWVASPGGTGGPGGVE